MYKPSKEQINLFMEKAIEVALNSGEDVPVGAVIVKDGKIISSAHNEKEKNNNIAGHAEILAMQRASKTLDNWRLEDCELYVTLEPCPMCAWAILQSRISKVYFGSYDNQYGAFGSVEDLTKLAKGLKLKIFSGILEEKCDKIIQEFWSNIRNL